MKFTDHQLEAVARLLTTEDYKIFIGALGDYGEKEMEKLVFTDNDNLQRQQGRTQALTAIVKAIHSAPETLRTLQTRKRNQ